MLYLIPAPLHRQVLRVGYRVRRVWWRLRRPRLHGVAVMARDEGDRVLLVRLSYGPALWSLPAGGMNAGEDPHAAIHREFAEELGCALADLCLLQVSDDPLHGATDRLHLFTARVSGQLSPDGREVVEARFFAVDDLPERLERRVRGRLELLQQA